MIRPDIGPREENPQRHQNILALALEPRHQLAVVIIAAQLARDVVAPGGTGRVAVAMAMRQERGDAPAHQQSAAARPTNTAPALRDAPAGVGDETRGWAGARRQVELPHEPRP